MIHHIASLLCSLLLRGEETGGGGLGGGRGRRRQMENEKEHDEKGRRVWGKHLEGGRGEEDGGGETGRKGKTDGWGAGDVLTTATPMSTCHDPAISSFSSPLFY